MLTCLQVTYNMNSQVSAQIFPQATCSFQTSESSIMCMHSYTEYTYTKGFCIILKILCYPWSICDFFSYNWGHIE